MTKFVDFIIRCLTIRDLFQNMLTSLKMISSLYYTFPRVFFDPCKAPQNLTFGNHLHEFSCQP